MASSVGDLDSSHRAELPSDEGLLLFSLYDFELNVYSIAL